MLHAQGMQDVVCVGSTWPTMHWDGSSIIMLCRMAAVSKEGCFAVLPQAFSSPKKLKSLSAPLETVSASPQKLLALERPLDKGEVALAGQGVSKVRPRSLMILIVIL
jgi:hypothetical protein